MSAREKSAGRCASRGPAIKFVKETVELSVAELPNLIRRRGIDIGLGLPFGELLKVSLQCLPAAAQLSRGASAQYQGESGA